MVGVSILLCTFSMNQAPTAGSTKALEIPPYTVLYTGPQQRDGGKPMGKRGDILIPSLSRKSDPATVEAIGRAIALKEGYHFAAFYSTEEAYKANQSASFLKAHPQALIKGFLGAIGGSLTDPKITEGIWQAGEVMFPEPTPAQAPTQARTLVPDEGLKVFQGHTIYTYSRVQGSLQSVYATTSRQKIGELMKASYAKDSTGLENMVASTAATKIDSGTPLKVLQVTQQPQDGDGFHKDPEYYEARVLEGPMKDKVVFVPGVWACHCRIVAPPSKKSTRKR